MSLGFVDLTDFKFKNYLKQREPFLFVDKVLSLSPWDLSDSNFLPEKAQIDVSYFVSKDLPCFQGHFPGRPIFPGVFLMEIFFQSCSILQEYSCCYFSKNFSEEKNFVLAKVESAIFKKSVHPETTLIVKSIGMQKRFDFFYYKGSVYVEDQVVANIKAVVAESRIAPPSQTAERGFS